jgi:hypothetical protein
MTQQMITFDFKGMANQSHNFSIRLPKFEQPFVGCNLPLELRGHDIFREQHVHNDLAT